jgi:hypothetical protein
MPRDIYYMAIMLKLRYGQIPLPFALVDVATWLGLVDATPNEVAVFFGDDDDA